MPTVGAIRWDAWFAGNDYERLLAPEKWRTRLPFYARASEGGVLVNSDSQEVMDREIAYAKDAGLDYWAFCYYRYNTGTHLDLYNYGLRRYLSSKYKDELNFCLILQGEHLGPKEEWSETVQQLVTFFKEPKYQKVLDGRPLVYILNAKNLEKWAGSYESATAALDYLDLATTRAGLRKPYLVALVFSAEDGARFVDHFWFDAISAYTLPGKGEDREYPYSNLRKANRDFWENSRGTGKQVIPIVNTGLDNRPRRDDPRHGKNLRGPWYAPPTPAELADHLQDAIYWTKNNSDATRANTILIYAWNETDEGGWLVPTHSEGTARLDAIKRVLQKR